MSARFTLGVEEEFQLVDPLTGYLQPSIEQLLVQGVPVLGEHIKSEMIQATIELVSNISPTIYALRQDLQQLHQQLLHLLTENGVAVSSSGTHPTGNWRTQPRTNNPRYDELTEEYQDVGRSIMIYGLHIHVAIDRPQLAIPLMNQLRTWLPHLLALSSNSPFWEGRETGLRSYRSIVWKSFPRSGTPNILTNTAEFHQFVSDLQATDCLDNGKKIWWDIRPHPFFPTLEFRVCDMPASTEDVLALAALCQALVAKLTWMWEHNQFTSIIPSQYIDENKWRAARYGLDARVIDFPQLRTMSMRQSIHQLLDFVEDVIDDLGSRREIIYLRSMLDNPQGTGADRQLRLYRETGSLDTVARALMEQTMADLTMQHVS